MPPLVQLQELAALAVAAPDGVSEEARRSWLIRRRLTDETIAEIVRLHESGVGTPELCVDYSISKPEHARATPLASSADASALVGRTIGVTRPGSSLEGVALAFLDAEGINRDDVKIAYLGGVPDLVVALQQGVVDAIAGNGYVTITQHADVIGDWTRFGEIGQYSPGVDAVYVAKEAVAQDDPALLTDFAAARDKAVDYIAAHPDDEELVGILKTWNGATDASLDEAYAAVLKLLAENADDYFGDFAPNLDSFEAAAEEGLAQGAITSVPTDWDALLAGGAQ